MVVTRVHLTSRNQIGPSVIVFFAVMVEPDPRAPHPPPVFYSGSPRTQQTHSTQSLHTTSTDSVQHNTLHIAHYTPAAAMAAGGESSWRSLVAQTPEDIDHFFLPKLPSVVKIAGLP